MRRSRARRVLRVIGVVVATTVTFSTAAVAGVALHLDLPAARRVAAAQVSSALASQFKGKVTVERIGRIGRDGIGGLRVRILDQSNTQVLFLDGVRAQLSLLGTAKSAIFGKGDIDIHLSELAIAYADVNLDADAAGTLRLQNALLPRNATPADPSARGVKVDLSKVVVAHGWVHGQPAGSPNLDIDADGLRGSVHVTPKETHVDIDRLAIHTRSMPNGANANGDLEAHLAMPSKTAHDQGASGLFVGDIGGIPATAQAAMDGKRIDATVNVNRVASATVRALVPEAPVYEDVAGHVEVHGELPNLAGRAQVSVGAGTIDVDARVALNDEVRADLNVTARHVDVRGFSRTAPASDVGANTEVTVVVPANAHGAVHGDFKVELLRGEVGTNAVPHGKIDGAFTQESVKGNAHFDEDGAPTSLAFDLHPDKAGAKPDTLDFDATTSVADLSAVRRIGPIAAGHVQIHAKGVVRLDTATLDAHLDGELGDVTHGAVRLKHAHLEGTASGPLANPAIHSTLQGEGLTAGKYAFARASVAVEGHALSPSVSAAMDGAEHSPRVEASAHLDLGGVPSIDHAKLMVARDDVAMNASVERVRMATGDLQIDGVVIEGLGDTVEGAARLSQAGVRIKVDTTKLDLARVSHLVDAEEQVQAGKLAMHVDLFLRKNGADGNATLDLEDGELAHVKKTRGHAHATITDKRLVATMHGEAGETGYVDLNTSTIELGGSPLDSASWRKARGKVQLDTLVDMESIAALLPKNTLPVGELAGLVAIEGEIDRDAASVPPELDLSVQTRGLIVAGKSQPVPPPVGTIEVVAVPPWRIAGMDVGVNLKIDGATGASELATRLNDAHGALAAFDAKGSLPYPELIAHPEHARERLETVPFKATLVIPRRDLDELPTLLQTKGFAGSVQLALNAEGTVLEPRLNVDGHVYGLKSSKSPLGRKTDAALVASYDGHRGDARVTIVMPVKTKPTKVLEASAQVTANVRDFLVNAPGSEPAWIASADVQAYGFPLQSIGALADRQVHGDVTGAVSVKDLHKNAGAQADLTIRDLKVGEARYTTARLTANVGDNLMAAKTRFEQTDGFAEASVKMGVAWGAAITPAYDPAVASEVSLDARGFRVAAVLPFVDQTFSELDGRVDADARVQVGENGAAPRMSGGVAFKDVVFEIPALGEEFHGAQGKITLQPDGVVKAENISANGVTGRFTAEATAKLNGFQFQGAQGALHIARRQALPLSVQGQEIGDVWGDVKMKASVTADRKTTNVDVDIPALHTRLPETGSRSPQDLDLVSSISVGEQTALGALVLIPLGPPEPPARAADAQHLHVAVHLGDIEIKRGTGVKLDLTGNPVIDIGDKAKVSGQVRLTEGFLDVQGKRFKIERGTVTFVGDDASNPEVVVTAEWDAPDGTQVFADFVGPLKTGKVTLRSEPNRPRNEILALILFGTADGATAAPPASQSQGAETAQAAGVGGGVATQGANKALSDLTGTDKIQTRVDTTDSQNPRPELEVQIARDVSLQIAYVLGAIAPGKNPDVTLATLDWRFNKKWSVETTFGNAGTSILDLIWQHRY